MNAISLYVTISRLVFQNDPNDTNYKELFRLIPYLRHTFLSCSVCGDLLVEPFTPIEIQCQHHVCKLCLGGKKIIKPSCNWCRDYGKYEENIQLRIVLQCYKSLCEHISILPFYQNIRRINNNINGANNLIELIQEGLRFQDDFTRNSGLSKSVYSSLPCLYANSSTQTINNVPNFKNIEENKKKETPPAAIKTVSNGSSLYIVAGTGNKITIKRKPDNSNSVLNSLVVAEDIKKLKKIHNIVRIVCLNLKVLNKKNLILKKNFSYHLRILRNQPPVQRISKKRKDAVVGMLQQHLEN